MKIKLIKSFFMIGIGLLTATGCSKEYTEHLVLDEAVAN
jgi:hypothetical protein